MHNQAHLMHTHLCLTHKVMSENTQYTIPLSLYIEVKNDSYYGKLTKLFQNCFNDDISESYAYFYIARHTNVIFGKMGR